MSQDLAKIPGADGSSPMLGFEAERVFASVFEVFSILDVDGRVIRLGGRIFDRTNVDPQLLNGQPFAETAFWQSSENTSRILSNAIAKAAEGQPSDLRLDFRVSADEKIPVVLRVRPLPASSSPARIFCCGNLINDRGRAGARRSDGDQLLFAAENTSTGLWFWDENERVIRSTPQCNELLGLPAHEPLSYDSFFAVLHPDDRDFIGEVIERSRMSGGKYDEEFRVVYPDGSVDWLAAEGRAFLDANGQPSRMVGVLRKVTQQKIAADETSKLYERERRAREDAEEANRAKEFFLDFVSHELRSSINAITGWAKILLTRDVDARTRQNALETIDRSARFQTKLINDLVDSSRVASGRLKLEYRPTNLGDLVRGSVEILRPTAENKQIELSFSAARSEIPVFADAGRLHQVFNNLISNAIKFTPEGGTVSVNVSANGDAAKVSVTDSGQGISPAALPYIFRQYSQGDAYRGKDNIGRGLGLSIVKILVSKHGGQVAAYSDGPGQGAEFVVTLPLTEPQNARSGGLRLDDAEDKPLNGLKLLVVEDDSDSREVLQLFLEQNGAEITAASSASVAFSLIRDRSAALPDLIISDLAMPQVDGYSLMQQIRALTEDEGGKIPAIALSAFTSDESRAKAADAGFNKYLTKPFDPDELVENIRSLTHSNRR